ncbi:MAG TPA: winged helix-turn-helix domain-containing protein [Candidatus Dormibacteraeota bacterium]|nr:winged helix-turn-helix domain-containing protein [Candidatus Dormibacteraeota bacterium]
MSLPGKSSDVVRFDVYEADLRAGELYKAGRKIKLQIQPFHVLALLLEHPGQVVTREDLQKKLWPSDTFVDFDHSLNTAIKKLRQALNDDKHKPRFVETLPKRGYRFIGKMEQGAPRVFAKSSAPSAWLGHIAKISADSKLSFALLSVDDETAAEREKLDAVNDDVGLSLLIASHKVLMVPNQTPVRILEVQQTLSRCQVRILEGEHYGKTALVPIKLLAELPELNSNSQSAAS